MRHFIYSQDQIDEVASQLLSLLNECPIVTFTGPLGAGKTTMIKAVAKQLGIPEDQVTSPTFAYLNIYQTPQKKSVYHFDLYRIAKLQDFVDAGFEEYLYQPESLVIIEWPEVIEPLLLTQKVCRVTIDYEQDKDKRILTVE